jgi:hypothetical protein
LKSKRGITVPYQVSVTLKNGVKESGAIHHKGFPPNIGDEIEVNLKSGRRVKARVNSSHTPPSKHGGSVVVEIGADEI